MLKIFPFFFLLLFISAFGKSNNPEVNQLFQKAGYELTISPDQAMEVITYIEKNFPLDQDDKNRLDYLKIKSLFYQNKLSEVLPIIARNDTELPENILILKRNILYALKMVKLNSGTLNKKNNEIVLATSLIQLLNKIEAKKVNNISGSLLEILNLARTSNLLVARENFLMLAYFFVNQNYNISLDFFYKKLINLYTRDPDFEMVYAQYLIHNGRLQEAEKIIRNLPTEKLEQTSNVYLKYNFEDLLVNYYAKMDNAENYTEAFNKKNTIAEIIDKTQLTAKNKWFNIFEENLKNDQLALSSSLRNTLLIITFLGMTCVLLILFRFYQVRSQIKKYGTFISKINLITNKKIQPGPQIISVKTENILLKKLADFEKSDEYTNSAISLQSLAKKLETNTKYLSETINSQKQKNFNAYINELRITYIINKLREDPLYRKYKIKYLAEESGFTTHSAFAAVFKSFTGLSPINYIQLLKDKGE